MVVKEVVDLGEGEKVVEDPGEGVTEEVDLGAEDLSKL